MNEQLARTWWIENLLRPVLIAGMMVCLISPVVVGFRWLIPGWEGTYLLVFAFFASLEGILSERALRKRGITGWGYFGSRTAEALLLLLVLKLLNYIPFGFDRLLDDAKTWVSDPYGFVNGMDLYTGMVFITLWVGSLYVARMVRELDVQEGKEQPPADKTSIEYYLWLTKPSAIRDLQERFAWLVETFLWGGLVLLLASTVIHFFVAPARVLVLPTLLYFALGITLLSQARFSVTHASWQHQGISIQSGISRRWLVWAVVFFVGVALVALVLPAYYSMGPLQALLGIIYILYAVVSFVISLILFLLILPLAFLFPSVEPQPPPALDMVPLATQEQAVTGAPPAWLQAMGSALFWLIVVAIVVYAFYRFWQDRFGPSADGKGARRAWRDRFLAWLRALWQRWRGWRQEVEVRLARRPARQPDAGLSATALSRFFFPGRLPPRELVRYFYLSAARRAAKAGQPRHPDQTPYEYRDDLDRRFPELEPDLEGLTEAFVTARYSRQPLQKEDAEAVKPLWQRIKAALQRRGSQP